MVQCQKDLSCQHKDESELPVSPTRILLQEKQEALVISAIPQPGVCKNLGLIERKQLTCKNPRKIIAERTERVKNMIYSPLILMLQVRLFH